MAGTLGEDRKSMTPSGEASHTAQSPWQQIAVAHIMIASQFQGIWQATARDSVQLTLWYSILQVETRGRPFSSSYSARFLRYFRRSPRYQPVRGLPPFVRRPHYVGCAASRRGATRRRRSRPPVPLKPLSSPPSPPRRRARPTTMVLPCTVLDGVMLGSATRGQILRPCCDGSFMRGSKVHGASAAGLCPTTLVTAMSCHRPAPHAASSGAAVSPALCPGVLSAAAAASQRFLR